jgi:hypothetical protein
LGRRLFVPTRTSGYLTHGRARRPSADPGSKSPGCQTIVAKVLRGGFRAFAVALSLQLRKTDHAWSPRSESEEMISLRLTVLSVLVAAAFAASLTYFITPLAPVDTDPRRSATMPTLTGRIEALPTTNIGQHPTAKQEAAAAFERAAETILKRLPDVRASAGADESPIAGHIPLPKRRPIPR